jgi:hypothetical protein
MQVALFARDTGLTTVQQPTDFWLDTFTVSELFASPDLKHSIVDYNNTHSQVRKDLDLPDLRSSPIDTRTSQSLLFLRIQAAASYFTTNQTLMREPLPVDVDIILDPFILNILPRSLGPTAIYITTVSLFAWFLSGYIYRWLVPFANDLHQKEHTE